MTSLDLINRSDSRPTPTQTAAGRERQEAERGGFEAGLRDKGKVKKRQRRGGQEKHRQRGRMGNRCQRLGAGLLERRRTGAGGELRCRVSEERAPP